MDKLEELRQVATKLIAARARVESQVQYRDRMVREALAAGATWKQVQDAAGLTPRGVALAVKRGQ